MDRTYLCIDLKSFYASAECVARGLDPMTTNLVVADPSRTDKTICLAVSPAMKALGVPELASYLKGECSLKQAVEDAKLHTRQYAKRQRTWFKNKLKADIELDCCYTGDCADILQRIERVRKS